MTRPTPAIVRPSKKIRKIRTKRDTTIVHKAMQAVRSRRTTPEMTLRRALRREKVQFQGNVATLPGKPDLVFRAKRMVVFVDGDFWHGRQWRQRGYRSLESQMARLNNSAYWIKKITGNMVRDRRVNSALRARGWRVMRVWESDIRKDVDKVIRRIVRALSFSTLNGQVNGA